MLAMVIVAIQNLWNKAWGYVIIGVAIVGAFAAAYFRGKKDERLGNERDVLAEDLQNRRQADEVRKRVDTEPDAAGRLRDGWSRPGS